MANDPSNDSLPPPPGIAERQIIRVLRELGRRYRAARGQRVLPRAFADPAAGGRRPVTASGHCGVRPTAKLRVNRLGSFVRRRAR